MLLVRIQQMEDLSQRLLKDEHQSLVVPVASAPAPRTALVVRAEQAQALRVSQYLAFEKETAQWLLEEFPDHCAMLGENGVRDKVRGLVQVAGRYGFRSQADAMRFIFISFLLGPDFELVPERDWIKEILDRKGADPGARMDELFEQIALRLETLEDPSLL